MVQKLCLGADVIPRCTIWRRFWGPMGAQSSKVEAESRDVMLGMALVQGEEFGVPKTGAPHPAAAAPARQYGTTNFSVHDVRGWSPAAGASRQTGVFGAAPTSPRSGRASAAPLAHRRRVALASLLSEPVEAAWNTAQRAGSHAGTFVLGCP